MPTITFNEFSVGLDHRKSATVSDANRLRELKNAFITPGKVIRKRPGLPLMAALEAGTKGLVSGGGYLNTFQPYSGSPVTHADGRFSAQLLIHTASTAYPSGTLTKLHYGDVFAGYIYVVAEYSDNNTFHYYISAANPNFVSDASCPQTKAVVKQEDRMWAVDGEVVRHTVQNDAADWSTVTGTPAPTDSGSLPVGRKARGSTDALVLGQFEGRMAVFFVDGLQLWDIGPNAIDDLAFFKNLEGIGSIYAKTPVIFSGDMLFLSRSGFRSVTTQTYAENLTDVDIGSPIDSLVRVEIGDATDPISAYFTAQNQYWCAYPIPTDTSKTRVWVYTYSKSAKTAAWSKYEVGFPVDDMVVHNGYLHFRSGDNIFRVDETDTVFADNGEAYEMKVEMPFIDCKSPGVDKYFAAMDLTVIGEVQVQFRYDPNDESKITDPITISGDTRPLRAIPLEITATAIAPVFTSSSTSLVQIDAFALHYETLGVW